MKLSGTPFANKEITKFRFPPIRLSFIRIPESTDLDSLLKLLSIGSTMYFILFNRYPRRYRLIPDPNGQIMSVAKNVQRIMFESLSRENNRKGTIRKSLL